jgi:hypothetical protein
LPTLAPTATPTASSSPASRIRRTRSRAPHAKVLLP